MKKIVFGITNLNIGGAEKVLVDLSNKLSDKYDITIFTIYNNGTLEKYLNKNIKLVSLYNSKYECLSYIKRKLISLIFTSKTLLNLTYNKYIKNKYDVEIAFLEGPITSLFAYKSNSKKIAWVHTDLSKQINNLRKQQYEDNYTKYNKIIFVSKDSLEGFNSIFNNNKEKLVVENYMNIDNIINKSNAYKPKEITKDAYSFVTVCRLVKAKALDRLAKVSKKLIENGYKHKIYVVGDGEERNNLENLIEELDIKDTFILVGMKDNPYPYINASDSFILTSLYEGYGMVLVEAMALNKNILITNTGSKEALKDYNKKLIVDNTFDGIYTGMKDMISNKIKFKDNNNKINNNKTIEKIINLIEGEL